MGTPAKQLPKTFRRYMLSEPLSHEPVAPVPPSKVERDTERKLHHMFEAWLRLNEIPYVHSRMDKKSTIRVGWPDFSIFSEGKTVFVEFKQAGKELSPEQIVVTAELISEGFEVSVHTEPGRAILWTKSKLGI
jgi:hypothetical protein